MIVAPILVGTGTQVTLAYGESVFVSATSTVASENQFGIDGAEASNYVAVYGYVAGGRGAINFGSYGSLVGPGALAIKSKIVVGRNGIVTSSGDDTIAVRGHTNSIYNSGEISGRRNAISFDITDATSLFNTVVNRGQIIASELAIISTNASLKVINYGVIEVIDTSDAAIRVIGFTGNTITNRGHIAGGIILADGSDRIDNQRGLIDGTVNLGGGSDTFIAGANPEDVRGGTGQDTLVVSGGSGVVIDLSKGESSGGTVEGDTYSGFENVLGSAGSDVLIGDAQGNGLDGRAGNDRLEGGAGADGLIGGAGNDILVGGAGTDSALGGAGADTFVFADGDFGGKTLGPADLILDYTHLDKDVIDLSRVDANTLLAGNQAFTFIDTKAFSNVAGQLRVDNSTAGYTLLTGDTNGDGVADFAIAFNSVVKVYAGDLVL